MQRLHLLFILIVGYASLTFAQNTATQGVPVNATVIQGVQLAVSNTLDFGSVVAGTTPAAINPNTATGIPFYTATGNGGDKLTVTYSSSISLTGPGTPLTFTPNLVGSSNSGSQSSATSVANNSTVTLSGSTGNAGNYYFWLGGALSAIPSNQTPGAYTGTFILRVTYTNH
jgi:hypothetical protein